MLKQLIPKISAWINHSVYIPGDSEDISLLKRIHWVSLLGGLFLVSPLIPISLILGVLNWTLLGIMYVGFSFIQLIIFYKFRRRVELFGFISQLFHVIFSFVGVLITGRIFSFISNPLDNIFQSKLQAIFGALHNCTVESIHRSNNRL